MDDRNPDGFCPLCGHLLGEHTALGCGVMACGCREREVIPTLEYLQARYPEVDAFARRMLAELWANRYKGDHEGWRAMSLREAWAEIAWHHAKLAVAIKDRDAGLVRELTADVANGAMMLADILTQLEARLAATMDVAPPIT